MTFTDGSCSAVIPDGHLSALASPLRDEVVGALRMLVSAWASTFRHAPFDVEALLFVPRRVVDVIVEHVSWHRECEL